MKSVVPLIVLCKISVKKMGLFTFITYLTHHIPDKYFRNIRGYGIFSNRLKGTCIPKVIKILGKEKKKSKDRKSWRDRIIDLTGNDPLVCDKCYCEMDLIYTCFKPVKEVLSKFCLEEFQRIPIKQFKIA